MYASKYCEDLRNELLYSPQEYFKVPIENQLFFTWERFKRGVSLCEVVISMYVKSEIKEFSIEAEQCMCMDCGGPIEGFTPGP